MYDGHTGVENKKVNEATSTNFTLVLAYLTQRTGSAEFVLHVRPKLTYSPPLHPPKFLSGIGLRHYQGNCIFHHDHCYHRAFAEAKHVDGIQHYKHVGLVHQAFQTFANRIDRLHELRQEETRILQEVATKLTEIDMWGEPVTIEIGEQEVPLWVEDVKFDRLRNLQKQHTAIQKDLDELTAFLPLVHGTGKPLESAVLHSLRFLGLEAQFTERDFTADILARTSDGSRAFGFEVTGILGAINKKNNKLTQVLDFERIKEHGEKTVLLANTHRAIPVSDRHDLEDFTTPAVEFLAPYPVLLMTGWDLYRLVGDVLGDLRPREEVVDLLHKTSGRFAYQEASQAQ